MSLYQIRLDGCDDSNIFDAELNDQEYAAIKRIADTSAAECEYGCEPILTIEPVTPKEN